MAQRESRIRVATYCTNCDDFTRGFMAYGGRDRCGSCGCFATTTDVCCAEHEIRESPYPTGECPICDQMRDIRSQEMHMATRDPMVEPF